MHIGICYSETKNFDLALEKLLPTLEHLPQESFLLNQISRIYYRMGQYQLALETIENAVKYDPTSLESWNIYANNLRVLSRHEEAMDAVFKALELSPQSKDATGTLTEIYAELNNDREFYKNLELSFSFGMSSENFQRILEEELIYQRFYKDQKFLDILKKYNIEIDWQKIFK